MTQSKDTNPKDALGTAKWRQFMTVPRQVLWELGVAMLEGALKYGRHNYRASGVRASVYLDAAYGHLDQFCEGEDIDKDSGLSHITKAMASLAVLRDAMMNDFWTDDRPPKINDLDGVRDRLQALVAENFERYADKGPHHYNQIEDGAPYHENNPSGQREEQFEGEREVDARLNAFAQSGTDSMDISLMELDPGEHVILCEDTSLYTAGTEFTVRSFEEVGEGVRRYFLDKLDGTRAGWWMSKKFYYVNTGGVVKGPQVLWEAVMDPRTLGLHIGIDQAKQSHGDDVFQAPRSHDEVEKELLDNIRKTMAAQENAPTPEERGFQTMFESLSSALPDGYVVEHQRVGDVEILHIAPGDIPIEDWNATDYDFETEEILRVAMSTDIHAYEAHLEDNTYLPDKPLDVLGDDDPSQILYVQPADPEFDRAHVVEGLTMKQVQNLVMREAEDIACVLYHGDTVMFDTLLRRVLIRLKSQPLRQVRIDFATGGSSERSTRLTNDQWFVACPFCRCTEMFGASPFVPRTFA